jgi:hypothetical protein
MQLIEWIAPAATQQQRASPLGGTPFIFSNVSRGLSDASFRLRVWSRRERSCYDQPPQAEAYATKFSQSEQLLTVAAEDTINLTRQQSGLADIIDT